MPSLETLLEEVVAGSADVASIPLPEAVEAAEALAEASENEILLAHVERVLPRLIKKDRVDEIEGIWLTCCTVGVLPRETLMRTAERLAARGHGERIIDLISMLADAMVEGGDPEGSLAVVKQGLGLVPSQSFLAEAKNTLSVLFSESPNLDAVMESLGRGVKPEELVEALEVASRALRYHPGTYLQWPDLNIAQIVSSDGMTAVIAHPSGITEKWRVDGTPPPKVLPAESHEIRRLYDPESLRRDWLENPVAPLLHLLLERSGVLTTTAFKAVLVPDHLSEDELEQVLTRLRIDCSMGKPDIPSYDKRRRIFVAPGVTAPPPKRSTSRPKKPKREPGERRPPQRAPRAAPRSETPVPMVRAEWVDLTKRPEIKSLIAHIEGEVGQLTREMNVDLPIALEEARAHGDLSENAEYDAAKERLRLVQSRIEQLHGRLAKVHELSRVRLIPGRITTMSEILVADEESGEERILRLVPPELPEPRPGDVSIGTPYSKALLGKVVGNIAVVKLPRRTERLEIVKVTDPT